MSGRRPRRINWNEAGLIQGDPDWMLPIMTEVANAFEDGRTIKYQELFTTKQLDITLESKIRIETKANTVWNFSTPNGLTCSVYCDVCKVYRLCIAILIYIVYKA